MSPKDVSGVFSRQFVVGHFLPAFFALIVAALATGHDGVPGAFTNSGDLGAKLIILGVAALPAGLLLSGLHAHLFRQFSGEAAERALIEAKLAGTSRRPWWRLLSNRKTALVKRQTDKEKKWRGVTRAWARDDRASPEDRAGTRNEDSANLGLAQVMLDEQFPAGGDRPLAPRLPTRLGNALRAFQTHADSRYGLDGELVWPRVEMLLDDEERAAINDARTDVAFFLNCLVVSMIVATWLVVDTVFVSHRPWWAVPIIIVAGVFLSLGSQRATVTAAYRWGTPVRAAVDLHRLELYERLGTRRPASADQERHLAAAINRWLRGEEPLPDLWRSAGRADGRGH
jgi:hypothetical protein